MDDQIRGVGEIALRKNAPVDQIIEILKGTFTDVRLSDSERPVVFVAAFGEYDWLRLGNVLEQNRKWALNGSSTTYFAEGNCVWRYTLRRKAWVSKNGVLMVF